MVVMPEDRVGIQAELRRLLHIRFPTLGYLGSQSIMTGRDEEYNAWRRSFATVVRIR